MQRREISSLSFIKILNFRVFHTFRRNALLFLNEKNMTLTLFLCKQKLSIEHSWTIPPQSSFFSLR